MNTLFCPTLRLTWMLRSLLATAVLSTGLQARVLDDFNDNAKTGWVDYTFVAGAFLPQEANQQFTFDLTGTPQTLFSASWKTTENLELREGRTLELRVDLVQSSGEDSFAVLAFIPNTGGNDPLTLAGYGLAKDPTDILMSKGINKYFVEDDSAAAAVKNDNVTLVLTLKVKGGSVFVTGKVLDKDNNNAVLWQRTVVDTPAADVLSSGTDSPAAPYITTGHFTLLCYANDGNPSTPFSVTYDNAEVYVLDETLLDDFNDNNKTDWTDFTFVPGSLLPVEQNQQFTFDMAGAPATLFSASWKTSKNLELVEGEQLELAVDLVQSTGEDAFYVMGFIPNTGGNDPKTLAGYGFAKDPTDILITKGIEKYFVADAGITAELKNDNVRLVLNLLVKNGTVWINARALDLDDNQAVLWERTVADTPGADVLDDGTDSPAAPYITSGYFTVFCYVQDPVGGSPYAVTYDNAVVLAPPAAANVAPGISDVQPAAYGNFLPAASTQVRFTALDDKALATDKVAVTLNGTRTTTANGLVVGGAGSSLTVSLGNLQPDQNYVALLEVEDSEGLQTTRNLYFDTFLPGHRVIEIEDYNHSSGTFIDNPVPTSEGFFDANSYSMLAGIAETDFHDTRATPNGTDTRYRPDDPVRMQWSLDIVRQKYTDAGGAASLVYDYDVGDIATGEWLHYTRNFASGTYEVYLRQALANIAAAESVLERVTGDRTQPNATTQPLGSFLGSLTGFQYRNFALTDGTGVNRVILRLSGVTTLRLRQVTPDPDDGGRYENYMVFVPVPDPGVQRATVASVAPANGTTDTSVMPRIQASLLNRDTAVDTNTVVLEINGQPVPATVTPTADGATVDHALSPLPASGSSVDVRLSFRDSEDELISTDWSFVLAYTSLDPATRVAGAGLTRGFNVRVVQAAQGGTALENSLQRAETQLAPNSSIAKEFDTNIVATLINYSQEPIGSADGSFPNDTRIPGLDEFGVWTDDIAMEVTTYLELAPGAYRFGNHCDDGYKAQSVAVFTDVNAAPLAFHNGGPANETYDFVVTVGGLYPFRLVWYERGGGAHVEWFSANFVSGQRTMLNDTGSPATAWSAIEALAEFNPPTLSNGQMGLSWTGDGTLEEAPAVTGPWAPSANQTNPQSVSVPGSGSKFYRVNQSP